MECDYCGQWHDRISEHNACEEAYNAYHDSIDEDGQIAMMRVLETNEVQRWETEQEEGMIAALWN